MTGNTSATGGYLTPVSAEPANDAALEDLIQQMIVGISGINGEYVRPRWQPKPPAQPAANVTWCAFGVTITNTDAFAYARHDSAGEGSDTVQEHEDLEVLASFYGPQAQARATQLRSGLRVPQNMEALRAVSIAFVSASQIVAAPALVNTEWLRRYDLTVMLRRQVDRTYAVLNLLSAEGTIVTDDSSPPQSNDWTVSQ